jgi:hypothetical protein
MTKLRILLPCESVGGATSKIIESCLPMWAMHCFSTVGFSTVNVSLGSMPRNRSHVVKASFVLLPGMPGSEKVPAQEFS